MITWLWHTAKEANCTVYDIVIRMIFLEVSSIRTTSTVSGRVTSLVLFFENLIYTTSSWRMSYSTWQHTPRILSHCERRFRRLWKRKDGARHPSRKWENSIVSSKNRIVSMALLPVRYLVSKIQMTNPEHSNFLFFPFSPVTARRLVVNNFSFSDGTLIPRGATISLPGHAINHDKVTLTVVVLCPFNVHSRDF